MKGEPHKDGSEGSEEQSSCNDSLLPERGLDHLIVGEIPTPLPILPAEVELMRIYFADLIDAALV